MVAVVAKALFASSSSDSDDFEIFAQDADTEESDAPTDPELGRSDYWECIKCKNTKNNPMYRFCEKCYQVNNLTSSASFFAITIIRWNSIFFEKLTDFETKVLIKQLFCTLAQSVPTSFHFYR